MRKLELARTGWIRDARVDFCKEGALRGALMVLVEMGGDASKGSFEETVAFVQQLLKTELPPKKIVRFTGAVDHDPNFTLLVKSLFDYGFELQCVVDDRLVYSWAQWMGWVIVRTPNPVVMSQANELWFIADSLPEDVTFPQQAGRATFCYVGGRVGVDEVDAFMCRSRHMWGLL